MKYYLLILLIVFVGYGFSPQSLKQTLWVGHCEILNKDSTILWSVVKVIDADTRQEATMLFNSYIKQQYVGGHLDFNSYFINAIFKNSYISKQNPMGDSEK